MSATPRARDYGRLYLPGRAFSMNRESSHTLEHWRMSKDNRGFIDNFDGDAINLDRLTLSKDSGATDFVILVAGSPDGTFARGVTGTSDNEYLSMYTSPHYLGDKDCGMEVAFRASSVANLTFEIGFADVLTSKVLPAIDDIDTLANTNGAGDYAVVHYDTDQTLATMAFASEGSGAIAAVQKTAISTLAPTANELMVVRIQLMGNNAMCVINEKQEYTVSLVPAIEGGTQLFAYAIFGNRAASASKNIDIDWFETWGDR